MLPKNYKKPSSYKTTSRKKPVYKSKKKLAAGGPGDPPKDAVSETPTTDNTPANLTPFALDYAPVYPEGISGGRLNESSKLLKNYFLDSEGNEVKEGDRVDFIKNTMGPYSSGSWLNPVTQPWSAVTTSYLMGEYLDAKTPEEMKAKGFRPDVAHASYIADAFETTKNPEHIYNRYLAQEIPDNLDNIQVGDLFFRGRGKTPNTFKGVKKASEKLAKKNFDRTKAGYTSHTDIVVEKGIDPKGAYVVLAGGNVGDTVLRKKVYLDDVKSEYAGVMVQNPNMKSPSPSTPKVEANVAQDFNPLLLPTFGMAAGGNLMTDGYINMLAAGGNMYAMGGPQDMLTNIENGGTHEENPLGGVPMGPNASVEQGETIQRNTEPGTDFVFSDRLPEKGITKEMAAEYNLPKNMVGKTFANASKTIEKQNHRKHDLIDKNTKDVALARLRDAQEEYKDRAFQEQLSEIEDKFGKSAADMGQQQPSPEEQMMMQQQMQGQQGQAPQPSPEEMMAMQMGMGQAPPQGIPAPQPAMPPQQMAPQMDSGMDPNREAQIRAALQNANGGPVQMAPGGPYNQQYGYENYGDPSFMNVLGAEDLASYSGIPYANLGPEVPGPEGGLYNMPGLDYNNPIGSFLGEPTPLEGIPPYADRGMDPMAPTNQLGPEVPEPPQSLYSMEGFDPVTAFQADYRAPIEVPEEMPALPEPQYTTEMPVKPVPSTEDFKDFNPNEWAEQSGQGNEFVDRYRQGIFADAYAKTLQSIKPIRERNSAAYLINAQYDPVNYPIEAQRKALKDISSSTRRLLADRMGGNPGMYMAMMGKVTEDEAQKTAELFDKKYTAEAADLQNIRQLVNQNAEFNGRMRQLIDELNEKDLQGKEQLALEAANSFAKTYQGLRKEDFMKFIGDEYKVLYGLIGEDDFLAESTKDEEDKKD